MPGPDDFDGDAGNAGDDELELEVVPTPAVMPSEKAPVVMVVDDDPDIRNLIVRALGLTHTVYEARDGEEARTMLEAMPPPDAIVCDVMMPRLDGLSLAKLLRKDPVLKRVPILFLTAREGALDVVAGINAGARHYITKPFKVADLVSKVCRLTGGSERP
ncbi:MAG: response regulator [Myxococcales bacterium]|nr:response regulator [Myxococcales bacterium]